MSDLLSEFPPNLFCLQRAEVSEFVETIAGKYELSDPVAKLCINALDELFYRQGGFFEPPADPKAFWLRFHNGSHAGFVMPIGVHLAHIAGESKRTKNAIALAAVNHDKYKGSPIPGEDERLSALDARDEANANGLQNLARAIFGGIIGTTVDEFGADVLQRARKRGGKVGRYLADADLASTIAPNAEAWSLRLYAENRNEISLAKVGNLSHILAPTISLAKTHEFLSEPGREILQPLMRARARELEQLVDLRKIA